METQKNGKHFVQPEQNTYDSQTQCPPSSAVKSAGTFVY